MSDTPVGPPTSPVGRRQLAPADRVRVTNHLERVLSFVPEPYPSGPPAEREAGLRRWREAHGEKDEYGSGVASAWRSEFAALAVNIHSTLGGWPPPDPGAGDLARVAREILERSARFWEAEWRFRQHRAYGSVPEAQRVEASGWLVEDGQWVSETLGQLLYSTPPQFEAFKDAVRQVVGAMVQPATPGRTTSDPGAAPPGPTRDDSGSTAGVTRGVRAEHWEAPFAEPRGSAGEPRPATATPPFDRLFPDYIHCLGFRERIAARYHPHPPFPTLPTDYSDGPGTQPRDRPLEWFDALNGMTMWDRTAALLDFGGGSVGGFADLAALEAWGPSLLRHFIERPETAFTVSVLVLDRPPDLRLARPAFGRLAARVDRAVPVLDHSTDPGGWAFPFEPGEGWEPDRLRQYARAEPDAPRFCREVAFAQEKGCDVSGLLGRCVLVYRRPSEHYGPEAVLHRLIDSVWHTMRDVSITHRLTTALPPRPPSTAAPIDRLHATFDALGNWHRETRRLHPDFVEPIYAEMRGEATPPTGNPEGDRTATPPPAAAGGDSPRRPRSDGPGGADRKSQPTGETPSGPFDPLRELVKVLRLKGNEADAVLAICAGGGSVAVADLAGKFGWDNPIDNWNSTRKRLNQKFKGRSWQFCTVNNNATAEQLTTTGRR